MAIARFDAYQTLAFGSITNSFVAVGSAIAHNWRILCITNATDGDMIFSFDGTTSNIFLPAGGYKLFDLATNAVPIQNEEKLVMQIGTQVYVKYSSAPSKGAVYIEGVYSKGE